jgi:hypothetical protein
MCVVSGLNSMACQNSVGTFVDSCRAETVCIQKTRCRWSLSEYALFAWVRFCYYVELPSAGATGEILVAWRQGLRSSQPI